MDKLREFDCPACGEATPEDQFQEGYCVPCRDERQAALNQHNASHATWQQMTDEQRGKAIMNAIKP